MATTAAVPVNIPGLIPPALRKLASAPAQQVLPVPVPVPVPPADTAPAPVSPVPSQPPISILVGTPAYGGMCYVSYVQSLISSMQFLAQHNVQIEPCFLSNESLIPRGRNTIVAKFMNNPKFTHLLFVDADVNWAPQSILRLLNHNKPIIGALYPKKGYDWDKLLKNPDILTTLKGAEEAKRDLTDVEISHIRAKLMSFVVNFEKDKLQVVNGLLQVKHLGTGFMLIQRAVLEKMSDALPELKYDDDINVLQGTENDHLYAFFNCEIHKLSAKNHYLSEDYMFCKRWTDMGGAIFADISVPLTHTGTHSFAGNFAIAHNFKTTASKSPQTPQNQETTPQNQETTPLALPEMNKLPQTPQTPQNQETTPLALALPEMNITRLPMPRAISSLSEAVSVAPMAPSVAPAVAPMAPPSVANRILPNQVGKIDIR